MKTQSKKYPKFINDYVDTQKQDQILFEINSKFSSLPAGSATLESDFRDYTFELKTKGSQLTRELITAMCRAKNDPNLYMNLQVVIAGL